MACIFFADSLIGHAERKPKAYMCRIQRSWPYDIWLVLTRRSVNTVDNKRQDTKSEPHFDWKKNSRIVYKLAWYVDMDDEVNTHVGDHLYVYWWSPTWAFLGVGDMFTTTYFAFISYTLLTFYLQFCCSWVYGRKKHFDLCNLFVHIVEKNNTKKIVFFLEQVRIRLAHSNRTLHRYYIVHLPIYFIQFILQAQETVTAFPISLKYTV